MEVQATQSLSGSSAAAYPRCVLLSPSVLTEGSYSTADANTVAAARSSTGHPVGVSLRVAAPPAESRLCVHFPDDVQNADATVIAAHGDSVLLAVGFKKDRKDDTTDYFVYNAGAAAAEPPWPPSLSLLPPCYYADQDLRVYFSSAQSYKNTRRQLSYMSTGLLRHGKDEAVMAELKMIKATSGNTPTAKSAQLLLFHSGEWSVKQPAISHGHGNDGKILSSWTTHTVVPVGDTHLCWFDMCQGLLFSNVLDEEPKLRYVPLPGEAVEPLSGLQWRRNVCAATCGTTVKLINIFPRCCCGGVGATNCRRSDNAYTITTWTLRMVDMVWVKDGMVDASELWALDAYKGLPRVLPEIPVVSMDDPHTICFLVCESYHAKNNGDNTEWLIMVDMRSKTLRSVYRYPKRGLYRREQTLLPSRLSNYFNSYPKASKLDSAQAESVPNLDVDASIPSNSVRSCFKSSATMQAPKATSPEVILAALGELLPGLARHDMLKAYDILCHDNSGRKFRFLLALQKNLRKEWLLMEIAASEACSICPACAGNLRRE